MNTQKKLIALVTGASSGIGRQTAIKLAAEGYEVAVTARRAELLAELQKVISDAGGSAVVMPADLREPDQISALAQAVAERYGALDVLVNNAGILHIKPFLEITQAELQEMLDVNIRSVFLLTQQLLPGMIDRRSGVIVNIASLAGKHGFKSGTGYAATKFALRGFAESLMMEVREHQIRLVTIFPGSVYTGSERRRASAPIPQSIIQPEDIADTVFAAISADPRTMISEIDMRPTFPIRPERS